MAVLALADVALSGCRSNRIRQQDEQVQAWSAVVNRYLIRGGACRGLSAVKQLQRLIVPEHKMAVKMRDDVWCKAIGRQISTGMPALASLPRPGCCSDFAYYALSSRSVASARINRLAGASKGRATICISSVFLVHTLITRS